MNEFRARIKGMVVVDPPCHLNGDVHDWRLASSWEETVHPSSYEASKVETSAVVIYHRWYCTKCRMMELTEVK